MEPMDEMELLAYRAKRLASLADMRVPPILLAGSFILIERSIREIVGDELLGKQRFMLNNISGLAIDDNAKGVG